MIRLLTERLVIRQAIPDDATAILKFVTLNKHFHQPTSPLRGAEFYTLDYQRDSIDPDDASGMQFIMFRKGSDTPGMVIGSISFSQIFYGGFCSCYLGYGIDNDYINQGLMTEALKAAIDHMFREKGLHRIQANVMPSNIESVKVLEKLGFNLEGKHEKYLKINGQWEDHLSFARINDDFHDCEIGTT